jgi:uncharacterized protein YndB with AHSA1/START domain
MTTETQQTVRVSRRFAHPAEAVFDAWLNPALAGKFLFATPDGVMKTVEIDAQVGGKFNIVETRSGEDAVHVGEYLVIDRPRRLVFSFGDNLAFAATTVTVEIVDTPQGCELTLTHVGVPEQWAAQTHTGWTGILEALDQTLSA